MNILAPFSQLNASIHISAAGLIAHHSPIQKPRRFSRQYNAAELLHISQAADLIMHHPVHLVTAPFQNEADDSVVG